MNEITLAEITQWQNTI
ncbi:hypothetical protein [Ruminococcus sp. D55t1_190419_H1]|nr:hypothetical protein [Ruminococcus sp. D55t1_190419_H1]